MLPSCGTLFYVVQAILTCRTHLPPLFSARCRLFCAAKHIMCFLFNAIGALFTKHPGWRVLLQHADPVLNRVAQSCRAFVFITLRVAFLPSHLLSQTSALPPVFLEVNQPVSIWEGFRVDSGH